MMDILLNWLGVGRYANTFGANRSPKWPAVEQAFISAHPVCAVCGTDTDLNVHHIKPFHINPKLELLASNLITLCREHHFLFGHFNNWASFNRDVVVDSTAWRLKIKERPHG